MREINELFGAGRVGLYEFIWFLNSADFNLSAPEKKAVAWTAANKILAAGHVQLCELRWARNDYFAGPMEMSEVLAGPDSWPTEAGEYYLALVPNEDIE